MKRRSSITLRTTSPIEITPTTRPRLDHRQVADVPVGHVHHALARGRLRRDHEHLGRHHLAHRRLASRCGPAGSCAARSRARRRCPRATGPSSRAARRCSSPPSGRAPRTPWRPDRSSRSSGLPGQDLPDGRHAFPFPCDRGSAVRGDARPIVDPSARGAMHHLRRRTERIERFAQSFRPAASRWGRPAPCSLSGHDFRHSPPRACFLQSRAPYPEPGAALCLSPSPSSSPGSPWGSPAP